MYPMKFSEMSYTRPDIDALLGQCKALAAKAAGAASGEELVNVYYEQSRAFADYSTAAQLASIHYTCDTRDAYWKAEQDFFDANGPAVENARVEISRAFLANAHVDALTEAFGTTCVAGMKNAVLGMDDRTVELQQQFNALVSRYQQIYGGALVELDGKQLTIPQLGPYKEDLDPAVRRAAYEAEAAYFDAHRDELDGLYTKIVKNLNAQAQILGYHDYSELSYVRMNRIGYGPAEIRKFRDQVASDVVPELKKVIELRCKRTGISHLTFSDLPVAFQDGNPSPIPGYDARMAAARTMYHELSPETAEFIDFMQDNELFDVESRPGKMSGGYMTSLPSYKAPFIFANFNGTQHDVEVVTHEAGHAFEAWTNRKRIPIDYIWPSMEACEVHSMSMEFFAEPWADGFFGPDAKKFLYSHLSGALTFIPYGTMVDHFQHIVYEKPEMTPAERHAVWKELLGVYMPWMKLDGEIPFYSEGMGWQRQHHIYSSPFYYIDYCLAQTVALEFWAMIRKDVGNAWQHYMAYTVQGGSRTFTDLLKNAGLESPFDEACLRGVCAEAEKALADFDLTGIE